MTRAVGLALAVLLALAAFAAAAQTPPSATVAIRPADPPSVGDLVTITITIRHDADTRAALQPTLTPMGEMDPAVPELTAVSAAETRLIFRTRAFQSGRFEIALPPIPLERSGQRLEPIRLDPITITVASVLAPGAEPRLLTPPDLLEAQEQNFAPWIVALIGIAFGFVAARLLRLRLRSRRRARVSNAAAAAALPEFDPSLPPAEQCRRLAQAVRERLAEEWSLPARALTTAELPRALATAGAPPATVQQVRNLLQECDRVQYAGSEPAAERLRGYHELAAAILAAAR